MRGQPALAAAAARPGPVLVHGQAARLDAEYAGDHWNAHRLGVPARRGRQAARFDAITQDWLRDLYVPKTSSMSCDQAIFVDQPTDAPLSSDAALTEIDRLG